MELHRISWTVFIVTAPSISGYHYKSRLCKATVETFRNCGFSRAFNATFHRVGRRPLFVQALAAFAK
jgi:hypothetical protein